MDKVESWPFIQNFFENRTRENYKVTDILAVDHHDKLSAAAAAGSAVHSALHGAWTPYFNLWKAAWNAWHSATNNWHTCTRTLENLLRTLLISPGGDQRSLLDDWESRIAAEWPVSSAYYHHFFPRGREEFNTGAREATIQAVDSLRARLTEKLGELQQAQTAAQAQADAFINNNQPVPLTIQRELDTANARVTLIATLALRISEYHSPLLLARQQQQACEGTVTTTTTALEKQRQRICRRMLKNFHALTDHSTDTESADPNPQYAAAGFFDLNVLMRPKSEDPPDDDPPPEPEPPPNP